MYNFLIITLIFGLLSAVGCIDINDKSTLFSDRQAGSSLLLADNGTTSYSILLPAKPTSQGKKAAEDLQEYLLKISGASFPIINEIGEAASTQPVISIGRTDLLSSALPDKSSSNLADEGYAIYEKDGNLFLFGGKVRGPISAVIAFLEEDLGCRWYTPSCIVIPKKEKLLVFPAYREFVPAFSDLRDPYYRDASDPSWMFYNRVNPMDPRRARIPEEWGGSVNYPSVSWSWHTYYRFIPWKKYLGKHPEYFAQGKDGKPIPPGKAGKLCLSNPEVLKLVIAKALEVLAKNPNAELIDVSQGDGRGGYCQCEKCRKIYEIEGNSTGATLKFANDVAEAIEKKHPKVKVTTLAYLDTFMPPKRIKPRKNVMITLATANHAWGNPYLFITETKKFKTAAKAWANIGAEIRIWDYTTGFHAYLAPRPNMAVIKPNIQFFLNHNVKGIMFQGAYQDYCSDRGPMRSWVMAKLLWNPSLNTRDLIKEFNNAYYGKAAGPLQEYNEMLWDLWENWHKNPPTKKLELDDEFIEKSMGLFQKAENLAENTEILRRVKVAKLSILYARLDKGLINLKDKEKYLQSMNEFSTLAKEFKLRNLREGGTQGYGIEPFILKWKARMGKVFNPPKKGVIVMDGDDPLLKLWKVGPDGAGTPKLVEDPLAENGIAIRQPSGSRAWSIHWKVEPKLQKGKEYSVRVRVRIDKRHRYDSGKEAFYAGIYNPVTKKKSWGKAFPAGQGTDQQYEWYDVGSFTPEGANGYFFIASRVNPDVNAIYLDRIEFRIHP